MEGPSGKIADFGDDGVVAHDRFATGGRAVFRVTHVAHGDPAYSGHAQGSIPDGLPGCSAVVWPWYPPVPGVRETGVREDLQRLVDRLPDSEGAAARRFLEFLIERGDDDEEPLSAEEEVALAQGLRDYRAGKVRPLNAVLPSPEEPRRGG